MILRDPSAGSRAGQRAYPTAFRRDPESGFPALGSSCHGSLSAKASEGGGPEGASTWWMKANMIQRLLTVSASLLVVCGCKESDHGFPMCRPGAIDETMFEGVIKLCDRDSDCTAGKACKKYLISKGNKGCAVLACQ